MRLVYKGGQGSGHAGHAGRPGKQGGSSPGTGGTTYRQNISASDVHSYVEEFQKLHNEASKLYKKAFKKVGARLWHDDDAHIIPDSSLDFIRDTSVSMYNHNKTPEVFKKRITTPLTVLDSYPDVTEEQREWLYKEVESIHDLYQAKLDAAFDKFKA
jgi:hypothetical protein